MINYRHPARHTSPLIVTRSGSVELRGSDPLTGDRVHRATGYPPVR